ncbi:MAG: response regulator [Chloroflexi bacterium]|nr:response regulator [Chloroflexota bacterium]
MTKILIVDDDSNNQRILTFILRKASYEVRVAENGVEGLALLAEDIPDLVVLDMTMPVMDGLTMLQHMRENPLMSKIPVIMLTASGDEELHQAADAESVNGFLTKPSSSRVVLMKIRQILGETE